jgi:hypothetical protein
MKIESIREKLSDAVSRAEKIAGKNPTLPVLAGLYLKAEKGTLLIRSTNLDLGSLLLSQLRLLKMVRQSYPLRCLIHFFRLLPKIRI